MESFLYRDAFIRTMFSKCILFRQCNLYGINSISVIDASLWIHLQESEFSAYDKMWIRHYIRINPHSLRTQLYSLVDIVVMIVYHVDCIDRLNSCWGVLQPNSPKQYPLLKEACVFITNNIWSRASRLMYKNGD